jgi:hypothetical protein
MGLHVLQFGNEEWNPPKYRYALSSDLSNETKLTTEMRLICCTVVILKKRCRRIEKFAFLSIKEQNRTEQESDR